jgi:hypothetical protein
MVIRMNTFTSVPEADDATALGPDANRDMTLAIKRLAASQQSTAEMLSELRREFPDAPLAVRIRALAALRKR